MLIVTKQQLTGEDALISLASPANRQGRQVADVIAGLPREKPWQYWNCYPAESLGLQQP